MGFLIRALLKHLYIMYLFINKTNNTIQSHTGNWPMSYVEDLMDNNIDFIIISLYSNSIKVPKSNKFDKYNMEEYKLPANDISNYIIKERLIKRDEAL